MNYSVEELIKKLEIIKPNDVTRGNIELFRSKLREYELIKDRQPLNDDHIDKYIKSLNIKKEENLTWEEAFDYILSQDIDRNNIIKNIYSIDSELIIQDLIWRIKNKMVEVKSYIELDDKTSEKKELRHIIYDIIIPNYVKLGEKEPRFKGSFGTDGNPIYNYLIKADGYCYLTLGKLNTITKKEDIHIYFNYGDELHPTRLKFIGYGSKEEDIFKDLITALQNWK